jgi:hypothetical protein
MSSKNNTVRWHDLEYLKIDGQKFIYRVGDNDEIYVIPPGKWVVKTRSVPKGRTWVREEYVANVAEAIPASRLARAGYKIVMPRVVRGAKYGT